MIFSQFVISALVICVSLCQMLKKDILSTEFLSMTLYLSTLLAQIFIYCWYANEVKLKVCPLNGKRSINDRLSFGANEDCVDLQSTHISEVVFESDWSELNEDLKRDLMFMMQRTAYPVEFSFLHMVDVNLDSFMAVNMIRGKLANMVYLNSRNFVLQLIKSSYSVYNILQQKQT